ncbi:hypothetical protein OH76DRAFT_634429 [Lentinus brumalis]|uniref:Uncharacterized protein n=1 Tax=Lentinus brumalis TaxID=2498619 RepID=A0A371D8K3_9APHY|nr:hypothetical protein OH76DRAFT_634429 [Polyporus brumalis]
MSPSSSEGLTPASTVSLPSGEAAEDTHFTPKLIVALLGCLVGFLIILCAFCVVSRRACCARSSSRLPQYNRTPAARRGVLVAESDRALCQLYPFTRPNAPEGEISVTARVPLPSPPPPYTPRVLSSPPFPSIGGSRPLSWLPSSGSRAACAGYPGPPATPDSDFLLPPPVYIALAPRPVAAYSDSRS